MQENEGLSGSWGTVCFYRNKETHEQERRQERVGTTHSLQNVPCSPQWPLLEKSSWSCCSSWVLDLGLQEAGDWLRLTLSGGLRRMKVPHAGGSESPSLPEAECCPDASDGPGGRGTFLSNDPWERNIGALDMGFSGAINILVLGLNS